MLSVYTGTYAILYVAVLNRNHHFTDEKHFIVLVKPTQSS